MRSSLAFLLALDAISALAKPIRPTHIRRQEVDLNPEGQDLNNEAAICPDKKNPETWYHYGLDQYVIYEALTLDEKSFTQTLQDYMPGLEAASYKCGWRSGDCDPYRVADHCSDNPKAAFTLMAVANMVIYLNHLFDIFQEVVSGLTPALMKFPETYNPKEITTKAGTTAFGGAGTALFFVGAIAAFTPGLNIISATGTAGVALNRLSTFTYASGALSGALNLGAGGDTSIEVQFMNAANIEDFLGQLVDAVSGGFEKYINHILNDVPDDMSDEQPKYKDDPRELPLLLKDGTFAGPIPEPPESMRENITAALAGPGINSMWWRAGVAIAKVNKDSLPIDPCDGDNLFPADQKYCDADGNMFVLQGPLDGSDNTNPASYPVPGLDDLERWHLSIPDIVRSAYKNQNENQSKGPDPDAFLDNLIESSPTNVPREDYLFFTLPVCDFAKNPSTDSIKNAISRVCGDFTEENASCWFYANLNSICPCQYYNGQGWPYNPTTFRALTSVCRHLSTLGPVEDS